MYHTLKPEKIAAERRHQVTKDRKKIIQITNVKHNDKAS